MVLRDRRVLVTGASSGIGWSTALELAAKGARVAACARRADRLEALCLQAGERGLGGLLAVPCDVRDAAGVEGLRARVHQAWGGIDVVVNNAGRGAFGRFEDLDPEVAREVVETNLTGAIRVTRAFLPGMLAQGGGHLVFISSVLGELPAPRHAVYGATKFALNGLAESLDFELGPRGVRILLVEPGLVRTEFGQVSGSPAERFAQVPHHSAQEVARAVVEALEREERRCVPDALAGAAIAFRRHFPRTARLLTPLVLRRLYGP
ncbi:MAG: SDR family oxidoreductase [Candidatus Latescibacterota bacterium]